ncbi:MFS transporter [Mycolicibacterium parafortuitum]|uniref:Major facilitator superfamily permease [Streptomyces bingchenggensis BCW-1] n=1 Tax=Mycolicibacterium parafortuitum TaxID=39692 RepID=A0A375YEP3_MYCPF|nr:MFS transporter [Mycolicibacterium parafortuitum]ORB30110.1 MFS transporter [Mycolicibacterium parafortuitum]SRX79581.1 major facilitator superfamily permease [Streptomyces bingchenggensis BCW-1] [Mycolicibacterium parafortuitum]
MDAVETRATSRIRAALLLAALCGAAFLEGIDIAMFNIALPTIRQALDLPTAELQWIVSGYVIGYGGFMLLGGRTADVYGRRRVFLIALVVFIGVSALGGIAPNGATVIAVRVVTGIAAAFLMPAGLAIITTSVPEGPQRDRAVLIYAGLGAAGFSLGLVAGGLLTAFGWRWVFFAPVVLASIVLVLAVPLIPRDEVTARRSLDLPGAVLVTGAVVLTVTTIENAAHGTLFGSLTFGVVAVTLFAGFAARQRTAAEPLVPLRLLRPGPQTNAYLGAGCLAAGFMGFQFIVVLYLQELRGWSALTTAVALLVVAIDAILAPTLTPVLVRRFGLWRVIAAGMVFAALSFLLFIGVEQDWVYLSMLPSLLALGIAFTLAYGPLTIAATDDVEESAQGLTSGLLYTTFQFGAAIGLATTTAVQVAATAAGAGQLDSYRTALLVPLVLGVIGVAVALPRAWRTPQVCAAA